MLNGYAYITVLVSNQDQALKFYQESLGLELRMDVPFTPEQRWITVAPVGVDYPEISLDVAASQEQKDAIGKQAGDTALLVFTTDDADKSHAEFKAKGVELMGEPESMPWGRQFYLKDLYGNLISVLQPAPR